MPNDPISIAEGSRDAALALIAQSLLEQQAALRPVLEMAAASAKAEERSHLARAAAWERAGALLSGRGAAVGWVILAAAVALVAVQLVGVDVDLTALADSAAMRGAAHHTARAATNGIPRQRDRRDHRLG